MAAKAFFDGLGHYSRPDIARLEYNPTHYKNLNIVTGPQTGLIAPEYSYLKEISEKYEVALSRLEKLAEKIEK